MQGVPNISMSLLQQKPCSAKASIVFKSHFHGTKMHFLAFHMNKIFLLKFFELYMKFIKLLSFTNAYI